MRLIDASGTYTINASDNTGYSLYFSGGIISVMDEFGHCICEFHAEDAPTVDAVPVVRCEKCKHCLLDLSGREAHLCMYKRKSLLNARVKRDDFCSWGERREGE